MNLSKKDLATVAKIIGSKAIEMHKKGASWIQGRRILTCVDMGKIANKILKEADPESVFSYPWDKPKNKKP